MGPLSLIHLLGMLVVQQQCNVLKYLRLIQVIWFIEPAYVNEKDLPLCLR